MMSKYNGPKHLTLICLMKPRNAHKETTTISTKSVLSRYHHNPTSDPAHALIDAALNAFRCFLRFLVYLTPKPCLNTSWTSSIVKPETSG